jgi:hypothetical protein
MLSLELGKSVVKYAHVSYCLRVFSIALGNLVRLNTKGSDVTVGIQPDTSTMRRPETALKDGQN